MNGSFEVFTGLVTLDRAKPGEFIIQNVNSHDNVLYSDIPITETVFTFAQVWALSLWWYVFSPSHKLQHISQLNFFPLFTQSYFDNTLLDICQILIKVENYFLFQCISVATFGTKNWLENWVNKLSCETICKPGNHNISRHSLITL